MLRNTLAAVGGYVVMVLVVFVGVGIAWAILGGEGAFEGEGPYPSTIWVMLNVVSGFLAALVAGFAARKMGTSSTAVTILGGLVLVLGIVFAVTADTEVEPAPKPVAELSFFEAGSYARNPTWYPWVIPFVGLAGILLGGRKAE